MRTLSEITSAVRLDDRTVTDGELRYAVVAYDVLLAQLNLETNVAQLQAYMLAAEQNPKAYAGAENDPANPAARAWYRAFLSVKPTENPRDGVNDSSADQAPLGDPH